MNPIAVIPLCKQTASEIVRDKLRSSIAAGAFDRAARLPSEGDLSRQFGVGRATIREAMRMLQQDGLVHTSQGKRGAQVSTRCASNLASAASFLLKDSKATFGELYETIAKLEIAAVFSIAKAGDAGPISSVVKANCDIQAFIGTDRRMFIDLECQMHRTLIEQQGNRVSAFVAHLLRAIISKHNHDLSARYQVDRLSDEAVCNSKRHCAELVRLISSGAAQDAAEHWHEYLEISRRGRVNTIPSSKLIELV